MVMHNAGQRGEQTECETVSGCARKMEDHMDHAMKNDSQHTVAARKNLGQLWFKPRGLHDRLPEAPSGYQELAELEPEARDVLRETFRLYSSEGMLSPWQSPVVTFTHASVLDACLLMLDCSGWLSIAHPKEMDLGGLRTTDANLLNILPYEDIYLAAFWYCIQ